jgi:hypothetical protein
MGCPGGYITRLGTCFHDRVAELDILRRAVAEDYFSLLIIYGPKRAGKSELLRYFFSMLLGRIGHVYALYINVKDRRGETALKDIEVDVFGASEEITSYISERLRELPEPALSTFIPIVQAARRFIGILIKEYRIGASDRIYVVADEFHRMRGYTSLRDRLEDLEAIASSIQDNRFYSNSTWSRVRAIVAVSDGYIFARDEEGKTLWQRLMGYGADYLFVGEMDPDSFSKTLEDYCSSKGYRGDRCQELGEMVISIAGRLPGWIPDIDHYIKSGLLVAKVRENVREFRGALRDIASKHNKDLRELAKKLYEAFTSNEDFSDLDIDPPLADDIISMNIAYRCPEQIYGLLGRTLRPQIRLYEVAAKLIAENRSIDISSKEDLKRILREHEKEDREKETELARA